MKNPKKSTDLSWLDSLSAAQREAVVSCKGPSLIIAGAGSGKTRVITYRIAYLIKECRVSSQKILALTFTNKAANEMKKRMEDFLSLRVKNLWIGTFHSLFARILRMEGSKLGLSNNFSIYDERDQLRLIKEIIEGLNFIDKSYDAAIIRSVISKCKNKLISPEQYMKTAHNDFGRGIGKIYADYNERLRKNNALDFEDLILKPIELFKNHEKILEKYQNRFQYIFVDEYQDTNKAQYQVLKLLAQKRKNICVVGDDDQSIYGWRGADISNIMDFEKDYADARIFKLEQNYRSTKTILNFAQKVVETNKVRRNKTLWTENENGDMIILSGLFNERDESQFVLGKIKEEIFKNKRQPGEISIFYRINALSRVFEEELQKNNIPYMVVGGVRFYERKEIRDILAYLKLISNPKDDISLLRIINYPLRGIGKATMEKVKVFAETNKCSLYDAFKTAEKIEGFDHRKKKKLHKFYTMIDKYRAIKDNFSLTELTRCILDETGILARLKEEGSKDSMMRLENIMEFLTAVSDYCRTAEKPSLDNYLQEIALVADIDSWNETEDAVSLITLHSAKGLEFPVVFIVGVEDNLIPYSKKTDDKMELEEERRLFYVGCTRAEKKLYLTYALNRNRYGSSNSTIPSRFLDNIDKNLVKEETGEFRFSENVSCRRKKGHKKKKKKDNGFLSVGQLVEHPSFGVGEIIDRSGEDEDLRVVVVFEGGIEKKLLVKYARLKML